MAKLTIPGTALDALSRSAQIGVSASEWQSSEMFESARVESVRALWFDGDGRQIGEEVTLDPMTFDLAEGFAPDGRIGAEPVARDIDLPGDLPPDARHLMLQWGAERLTVRAGELVRTDGMPGAPLRRKFPDDARSFYYPVISDGFLDAATFFAHVADLTDWMRAQQPFDGPELEPVFGMEALFWAAPGEAKSHFGAPLTGDMICAVGAGTPVLLGSREDAARKLRTFLREGQGLILMNSSQRGGAGGSAPHDFPAWASINACPGEDWRRIALHEIGHSLGLEDEYVLPDLPVYATWRDMTFDSGANATSKANPARTPWKTQLNLGDDEGRPTVSHEDQDGGWVDPRPGGKPLVGTVAGAHYHEKYFRPSGDCLMRSLAAPHFCPVCQRHIIDKLR